MQRPQNPKPASVTAKEEESESADVLMLTDAENPRQSRRRSRRRITTVYDAVAGQVWPKRASRDEAKRIPLAPDELLFGRKDAQLLFRRKNAVLGSATHCRRDRLCMIFGYDIYNAHERDIPRSGSKSVLKGFKGVGVSRRLDLRGRVLYKGVGGRDVDERSMDETALLAFGILLEEAGREALGRLGALVFTEADDEGGQDEVARDDDSEASGYQEVGTPWKTAGKGPKRRKVVNDEDGGG
ncbi:membrane protein [Ophiocordyceps sinensis CO18]|uniref:Membrane protein n=1 Tax=Ophiocordyceps sinensis (strain Co18 / CGMCC 3.14243) TaxID=911162 RepID=T4ZYP7_OPHSC|nr:membrane protein [Ophiocordyceps sinensis CO18]